MKKVFGFIAAMAMTVALSSSAPVEEAKQDTKFCSVGAFCNDDNSICLNAYWCDDSFEEWDAFRRGVEARLFAN